MMDMTVVLHRMNAVDDLSLEQLKLPLDGSCLPSTIASVGKAFIGRTKRVLSIGVEYMGCTVKHVRVPFM